MAFPDKFSSALPLKTRNNYIIIVPYLTVLLNIHTVPVDKKVTLPNAVDLRSDFLFVALQGFGPEARQSMG